MSERSLRQQLHPTNVHAGFVREAWAMRKGKGAAETQKVEAHLIEKLGLETLSGQRRQQAVGNDEADLAAKAGASLHPDLGVAVDDQLVLAKAALRVAAAVLPLWGRLEDLVRAPLAPKVQKPAADKGKQHRWGKALGHWQCLDCGTVSRRRHQKQACAGSCTHFGKVIESAPALGHSLAVLGFGD